MTSKTKRRQACLLVISERQKILFELVAKEQKLSRSDILNQWIREWVDFGLTDIPPDPMPFGHPDFGDELWDYTTKTLLQLDPDLIECLDQAVQDYKDRGILLPYTPGRRNVQPGQDYATRSAMLRRFIWEIIDGQWMTPGDRQTLSSSLVELQFKREIAYHGEVLMTGPKEFIKQTVK